MFNLTCNLGSIHFLIFASILLSASEIYSSIAADSFFPSLSEQMEDENVSAKSIIDHFKKNIDFSEDENQSWKIEISTIRPNGNTISIDIHWQSIDHYKSIQKNGDQIQADTGGYQGRVFRFNPGKDSYELMPKESPAKMIRYLAMMNASAIYTFLKDRDLSLATETKKMNDKDCYEITVNDNSVKFYFDHKNKLPVACVFGKDKQEMKIQYIEWKNNESGQLNFNMAKLIQNNREIEFNINSSKRLTGKEHLPMIPKEVIEQSGS